MKPLLRSLRTRHEIVDAKIGSEQNRPMPDTLRIRALKKIKMRIKEQIAFLEREERTLLVGS